MTAKKRLKTNILNKTLSQKQLSRLAVEMLEKNGKFIWFLKQKKVLTLASILISLVEDY